MIPKGHQVGMGRLKEPCIAVVDSVHECEGGEFYRVHWISKQKQRSTYVNIDEVEKLK